MTARSGRPVVAAADGVAATGWREAVRAAASVLVDAGTAAGGYPEACVRVVEENGPYIVLTKGLALVHARPEEGGLAVGVGVTRLVAPVGFGHPDNDPVDLLLAFCTPDPDAHVGTLSGLARALSGGLADRLRAAAAENDLARTLEEALSHA